MILPLFEGQMGLLAFRLAELGAKLMALGPAGLFAISFLDSAFVPLPSGPDVAMIALSAARPGLMPLYAATATLGSAIGCLLLYSIARRGGEKALSLLSSEKKERIENLLGRYDMFAVMAPALLPPPFPFKVFVVAAGAFRLKTARFLAAIVIGRGIRFLIEGWLAVQFGAEAWNLVLKQGWKALVALAVGCLLLSIVWLYRRRATRKRMKIYEPIP
jgi:membrane protein YqaA with SNARE-associated domain